MQAMKTQSRTWLIGLGGAITAAAILKTGLIFANVVPFNSDEAIVALMARHILEGGRPIFFYGQSYMGSLDAYLVAAVFKFIGYQVGGIRLVQIILYSLTILTTAILGKQLTGKWKVGVLAAWFLAIPNVSTTLYTTVSLGGYGEMLLIGNLILLTGVKIAKEFSQKKKETPLFLWFGLGFLSGFGLWVFGLTLVYSLPVFAYLIWIHLKVKELSYLENIKNFKRRYASSDRNTFTLNQLTYQSGRWATVLLGGFFGAIPWWSHARYVGFPNLVFELSGSAISGVESLGYLDQVLKHGLNFSLFGSTVILGLRPPWEVRWLAYLLAPFVLFFWFGVMGYAFRKTSQELSLFPDSKGYSFAPILSGVFSLVILGFILSPFGADPSGRYYLPLSVVMALFASQAVWSWHKKWGRYVWVIVGLIFTFHIWGTIQVAQLNPPGITTQIDSVTQIDHAYDQELIDFLNNQGETSGYSNYWVAYPLAFQSEESLVFVPKLPYHQDLRYTNRDNRYEPYDQLVNRATRIAYITTNNPELDLSLRRGLTDLGIKWKEESIGDYRVYYQLSRRVEPEELGINGGEG